MKEMILFGSYARNDADNDSDVDVMVLSDMSRQEIASLNWQLGEITSDILLDYGVLISPIIENDLFFAENTQALPFFQRIHDEGIRINTYASLAGAFPISFGAFGSDVAFRQRKSS